MNVWIPGDPVPQSRPRTVYNPKTKRAWTYSSSNECEKWRDHVRQTALAVRPAQPISGAVKVQLAFYFRRPKTHYRKGGSLSAEGERHPYPKGAGDVDNLAKAVTDALTGVVFEDDGQIVSAEVIKSWCRGGGPGVQVLCWEAHVEGGLLPLPGG